MSKGNSNGTLALGIILGAAISIFAVVKVIGLNYCPETPCNYDYKHSHGPTDGPTQHQGWIPNPFLPNFTLQPEPNLIEKQASQYEYADLQAQENMARATNWIAWFSLFGFVTAGAGVILLVRNLNVTREVGRDQSRAYVEVSSVNFRWGGKKMDRPKFSIIVRNSGATPAKWFQVRQSYLLLGVDESAPKSFDSLGISGDYGPIWSGLAPGGSGLTAGGPDVSDDPDIQKCRAEYGTLLKEGVENSLWPIVFGEVRYCTVHDEVFVSQFCFNRAWLDTYDSEEPVVTPKIEKGVKFNDIKNREIPQEFSRLGMALEVYKRCN